MHMSTHIYVCIHIRWTCTYIFKCPFKYIIYKHIYIYNTHINPVCEETLGPLVLEYIYIYMLRKTHQMSALSFYSDQILPLYIYMYICICIYMHVYSIVYMYIYIYLCMYVCVYMSACVHKKTYTHIYACMYIYIYACMYTNTMDMHIYV